MPSKLTNTLECSLRFACLILLCFSLATFAQSSRRDAARQDQTQQATSEGKKGTSGAAAPIRVDVNLVVVPVVVRDALGHPVTDLQKDNFEIRDNKKLETIEEFSVERAEREALPSELGSSLARKFVMPTRFTVLLFDDIHMTNDTFPAVRAAAIRRFSAEPVAAAERVAIFTTSGGVQLDFTDDRAKIVETLNKLKWKPYANTQIPDCLNMSHEEVNEVLNRNNQIVFRNLVARAISDCDIKDVRVAEAFVMAQTERVLYEGDAGTNQVLAALKDVVQRLSRAPGTRDIVLLSPGFLISDREHKEYGVINLAIQNRVTISSIDANGLSPEFGNVEDLNPLAEFADGTGGMFFRNDNDFAKGIRRVSETAGCVYLLGFSPSEIKNDGAFHRLDVKIVGRAQLTAKWRKGYLAAKAPADAKNQKNSSVVQYVFSRETMHGLPIEMRVQFVQGADPPVKLSVIPIFAADGSADQGSVPSRVGFRIIAAVFDRNGAYLGSLDRVEQVAQRTSASKVSKVGALEFLVDPGIYLVRLVVYDTMNGEMFADNSIVEIPAKKPATGNSM